MVTLTFVFDDNKVTSAGLTEDELLSPMREHAQKYGILEKEYGVFSKDGADALCVIGMFIPQITDQNPHYIDYLQEWILNVDGEPEDCIQATHRWRRKSQSRLAAG